MLIRLFCFLFLFLFSLSGIAQQTNSPFDQIEIIPNSDGQWEVNANMRKYIEKSFELIDGATPEKNKKRLAKKLLSLAYKFEESCGIEDEVGHHQIHKWFLIYEDVLFELTYNKHASDRAELWEDVLYAKVVYQKYFK